MPGSPSLFGPHMENFRSLATQLLAADGAIQVMDADDLQQQIARLLTQENVRRAMSERARGLLLSHRGAARRTAEILLR